MSLTTQLTPNGSNFSKVVFGTWRILEDDRTRTKEKLLAVLKTCLEVGITTIDTAEIYGGYRVEETIGSALNLDKSLRQHLQIVTKCGIYVPNEFHPERKTPFYNATAERIIKSAEKSLRFLNTDYIDLLLVHRPDWLTCIDDTAKGLNQLLAAGKIRNVGVSNYSVSQFEALNSRMDRPLVTNQVEFSLLHMDPIYDGTFDHAQQHRYKPMAWSPLARALLMDPTHAPSQRVHTVCKELSAKYDNASADQLAYAWIMAHPSQPLTVIGTSKTERVHAAAGAAQIKLDREDWYALWTAAMGHSIP